MVTMGVFPFQEKTHMVEPRIEPGTSWLVVRSSDHQATRLVGNENHLVQQNDNFFIYAPHLVLEKNEILNPTVE